MARAKSPAENGSRSSTCSPTPMKCTGSLCFAAMATRMPPRAVPSSLVMTSPVTPASLRKISTWIQRVLSGRRVEGQQHGMRRLRVVLPDHADDLLELGHQLGLVLQAAGGVDDEHVGPGVPAPRRMRRRQGPPRRRRASRTRPATPVRSPQIFSCSIAAARNVSPAASITDCPPVRQLRGELADGRRLARAVDADHQDDMGLVRQIELERLRDRRRAPSRSPRP